MSGIPVTLKWGKSTYAADDHPQLLIWPGEPARNFKLRAQSLTGVPVRRQKLLCPKVWKGALKDDVDMPPEIVVPRGKRFIAVTLIGSADALVETPVEERPRFEEDMTAEEIWRAARGDADGEDDGDAVDIPALQKEPGMDRDDGKMETYQYNRLVSGLPQRQINDALASRKKGDEKNSNSDEDDSRPSTVAPLLGEAAMTMGMELRRAYINSLAVLSDGTIVSGSDDGHVQLWRRGQLINDARHTSAKVDHVLAFPLSSSARGSNGQSFVTAGDGSISLWTQGGEKIMQLGSHPGTSPASIAVGSTANSAADGAGDNGYYLAVCLRVTREVDPNRFRLVPQNEAERRRREAAEMQERMIERELSRVSSSVQIWHYNGNLGNASSQLRQDVVLLDVVGGTEAPAVTKLLDMNGKLVCGDAWGGLRIFEWVTGSGEPNNNHPRSISRRQCATMQFRGCSIACIEQVEGQLMAVSVEPGQDSRTLISATSLPITRRRGVYIVDTEQVTIKAVLDAHTDTVRCMCTLPDGGMLTAGGKMDATVRVWDSLVDKIKADYDNVVDEEARVMTEARIMKQPGYVFDLKVLPDSNGSGVYAVAAARYNVIKIII